MTALPNKFDASAGAAILHVMQLRSWRRRERLSLRDVADLAGVSHETVRMAEDGLVRTTTIADKLASITKGAVSSLEILYPKRRAS